MASASRNIVMSDEEYEQTDPFESDDDDSDYEPNENETDLETETDSDTDFLCEEVRRELVAEPSLAFLSKDKKIEYSLDQPNTIRQTICNLRVSSGTNNLRRLVFNRVFIIHLVSVIRCHSVRSITLC